MSTEHSPESDSGQPMLYQIRIKGHLGSQRAEWFEGLTITLEEDGYTLLTGPVVDQAAVTWIAKKSARFGNAIALD